MPAITPWLLVFVVSISATAHTLAEEAVEEAYRIKTNLGDFVIEVWPEVAPKVTKYFSERVEEKYYDKVIFHRVVSNFVIQTGLIAEDGTEKPKRQSLRRDSPLAPNQKYMVGAATAADSMFNGQFFVNLNDNIHDDSTVFGRVLSGTEVVDKIGKAAVVKVNQRPVDPIVIQSIERVSKTDWDTIVSGRQTLSKSTSESSSPWMVPRLDATFVDEDGKPFGPELVSVVFRGDRVKSGKVWTGEAWAEQAKLLTAEKAIVYYTEEIKKAPSNLSEALRRRAALYRHRGELTLALMDYDSAIDINPSSPMALAGRGIVYRTQGSLTLARADLESASKLRNDSRIQIALGNVASDEGDSAKAIKCYEEALKLEPKSALAISNIGGELARSGDYTQAINKFNEAYGIDKNPGTILQRASAKFQVKSYADAENDAKTYLTSMPGDATGLALIAAIQAATGRTKQAEETIDQALKSAPDTPALLHNRGMLRLAAKGYDQALQAFESVLRVNENYLPTLLVLARFASCSPDSNYVKPDLAVVLGLRAVEITRHKEATAYSALACAYAAKGSFDNAVRCQQKAIELARKNKANEQALTGLQAELGRFQKNQRVVSEPVIYYEH